MAEGVELITPYFPVYPKPSPDGVYTGEPPTEETLISQLLAGDFSALFGGAYPVLKAGEEWPRCRTCAARTPLVPYLQINLSTARTPAEFSAALPPVRPFGVTLFQVFICTAPSPANPCSCFEDWSLNAVKGESWCVRTVHFDAEASLLLAPDSNEFEEARRSLDHKLVFPQRRILTWKPGNPEAPHHELLWERYRSTSLRELYEAHKPLEGLKLLGHAVLGKLQSSPGGEDEDPCAACAADRIPSYGWDRRCFVQLGTNSDIVNGCMFWTTGNSYIYQCKLHPHVFQAGYSFSW